MLSSNQESPADSIDKYYLEEAGSARDGRFVVKLKIPKPNEGIEEGETASSVARKEHYCADCDKSFSNGKALGGHMSSAHVQAGKDYQSKKLRLKNCTKFKHRGSVFSADNGVGDGARIILCKICGKDFPSRKSLYGHMRCHPDREYRGMQPPVSKKTHRFSPSDYITDEAMGKEVREDSPFLATSPPSSGASLDEPVHPIDDSGLPMADLTKFLSSWAVTGQRGRQANNPGIFYANSSLSGDLSLPSAGLEELRPPSLSSAGGLSHSSFSTEEAEALSAAAYSLVNLGTGIHLRHKEEDQPEEAEDMSSNSMTPDAEIEDMNPIKKPRKEVYAPGNAQGLPVKPTRNGETKSNSDADYYEDLKRCYKSKRQRIEGPPSTYKRQFSPVKKLRIDERTPEKQIPQPASYKGKGKAPMEPKFHEFHDAIHESDDEEMTTGSDYVNKSFADDSDSERTPEQQNYKYLAPRRKNGFVWYKKRLERDEGSEKALSIELETNLIPAEKKDGLAESTPEKYKCSTCNKCFPTHQALGGHRSSHNKLRVSIQNTTDDSSAENQSNSISQILEAKEGSCPGLKLTENPHQCQICNKTFFSGQALGGHMRCHATGPSSQAASPEEDIQSVRKFLKFDLNELPDIEDADSKNGGN